MNVLQELKTSFITNGNSIKKIIVINAAVFVISGLISMLIFLTNANGNLWSDANHLMMLPASLTKLLVQPWSLVTYLFLHDNFFHILFNMLWLYWIGNILQEYLGDRKVYETYFTGGIFGGIIFLISYNVFPVFSNALDHTFIIGASGSVLAIVFATATLLPDYTIQLLFFGPVKLKWLALASLVLDLINIPNGNPGGHIAHIGGALAGFLYIKFLYKRGGHLVPDKIYHLFTRQPKLKVVSHNTSFTKTKTVVSQEEIDAILDKISKSGYDSLSKREKETLFKASK